MIWFQKNFPDENFEEILREYEYLGEFLAEDETDNFIEYLDCKEQTAYKITQLRDE